MKIRTLLKCTPSCRHHKHYINNGTFKKKPF
uniref:Uncharacterized protein n=1 Tax=Anguilla anguilla TaxID=7936 RepID=A0A0E9P6R5_ANGAN